MLTVLAGVTLVSMFPFNKSQTILTLHTSTRNTKHIFRFSDVLRVKQKVHQYDYVVSQPMR